MKLVTSTYTGNYDWCHPTEKQLKIAARIEECKNAPEPIHLTLDINDEGYWKDHLKDAPIEAIIEAIADQKKRFTFSTAFKDEDIFSKFINEHYTELYLAAKQDRLIEIDKELNKLSEERIKVINSIKSSKDELQLVNCFLEIPFTVY